MRFSPRSFLAISAFVLGMSAATARAQITVFYEDFSTNNQGWTLGPEWQIGPATASGAWSGGTFGDPGSDADGVPGGGVAGVVLGGNCTTGVHADYNLESPIIPLSPGLATFLNFKRWLNSDYPLYITNSISVFDGTNWVAIYVQPNNSTSIQENSWVTYNYDVSAYANAAFQVRFSFNVGSTGAFASPSWNVDNVKIEITGYGQPNTPTASLTIDGNGPLNVGGPWSETIGSTVQLDWLGNPGMPFILAGSVNEGPYVNIAGLGLVGIGTGPTFSDVFIIFDGNSFPGSLYATIGPVGTAAMTLNTYGIPSGLSFYLQGLVGDFAGPVPFVFTASHHVTKL